LSIRLNAYVLAGEPSFIAASVQSYYAAVERIVVAHDDRGLGWSGNPMPVEESLRELRHVDPDRKLEFWPLTFADPALSPMACDTRIRQAALDRASEGADWVLQIDADEVIADLDVFLEMLHRAHRAGARGLDFPSRWIYARTTSGNVLECSTRWWRAAAGYPGPLAVKGGTTLRVARQCEGSLFRVDFRRRNTDPWHARGTPVHSTVPVRSGVIHFSWVRTAEELLEKARTSTHRHDFEWEAKIAKWRFRQRHPWLATALTPLRRKEHPSWLRRARLPVDPPPRVTG
jgi:hypothetical protein